MSARLTYSQTIILAAGAVLLGSGCGSRTDVDVDTETTVTHAGGFRGMTPSAHGGTTSASSTDVIFFPIGGSYPGTRTTGVARGGSGGTTGVIGTAGRACLDELETRDPPVSIRTYLGQYSNIYHPSCAPEPDKPDFIYGWWVSSPDTYVVSTLGSSMDTTLAAYDGYCGRTELACNDDDAGLSRQSRLVLNVSAPQWVTFVVHGAPGDFTLRVERASALVDVVLNHPLPIRIKGTTVGRRDTVTSTCGSRISSNDMTFLFTAPSDGTFQFVVNGKSFWPALSLRQGGPAGEEISCNLASTGKNSSLSYAMRAGQSVAVIVDGLLGEVGDFDLAVSEDPSDSGSCCESSMQRAGCIDQGIMQCVCKVRHDCCYYFWDPSCVDAMQTLGCGSCPSSVI